MGLLHLPHGCRSSFGFPSTHAADVAALAAWVEGKPKHFWRLRLALILWSVAVAYSRVGVHHPFDVLAGTVLGGSCELAAFVLVRHLWLDAFGNESPSQPNGSVPPLPPVVRRPA